MADNVDITPGTGKTIAADDVSGVLYQKVKLDIGGDGASTPVTDLATSAKQDTGNTSLSSIDSKIPASPATSGKQDTGNTSLASIDGKITAVNTGAVTISAALPAGTNAIGKLAANSGVDIGDVDVTTVGTITPGTAATNLGKAEDAAHSSGDVGVMALAVRTDTLAASSGTTGDYETLKTDSNGALWGTLGTKIAGEDLTNDVLKSEQRFSYVNVTADTQVKSGAGFLHSITFIPNDAAPTAGSIILYDNTAESGTKILDFSGISTTWFAPFTLILDVSFSTGLYVGYTTTADVNCTVAYR